MPKDSTWISFNFHSGAATPGGGPFVGAFIDDVVVQAEDAQAPVSRVGTLPAMLNNHVFEVPVKVTAQSRDLYNLKLYCRVNGSGSFALYTSADNAKGEWDDGPISFVTRSDGRFEFFSIATDRAGNAEPMKSAAEAAVTVDTVCPFSSASVTGEWGNAGWFRTPARVNITATDSYSGIASNHYRVDGGGHKVYTGEFTVDGDGYHKLEYYAEDKAGNGEAARSADIRVDCNGPSAEFEQRSGITFGSGNLEVKLKITDRASGVDMARAGLDGGGEVPARPCGRPRGLLRRAGRRHPHHSGARVGLRRQHGRGVMDLRCRPVLTEQGHRLHHHTDGGGGHHPPVPGDHTFHVPAQEIRSGAAARQLGPSMYSPLRELFGKMASVARVSESSSYSSAREIPRSTFL